VILILLAVTASAALAQPEDGLVAYWALDDAGGLVAVDGIGGNDGVLQGDATWVTAGYSGGAVLLDGEGDYINCGSAEAFNITDAVTLAAWVKADGEFNYPDWSGIIMRGGPNIDTFALYYNRPTNRLGFKTTGTDPAWFATANEAAVALFDGDWHHTGATYDGQTKVVYVDGEPVGEAASSGQIETSDGNLLLGAGRDLSPPTHFVAGMIDEARIYDRALSADEMKTMIPPRLKARQPVPEDGDMAVLVPLLRWTAGDTAMLHEVYFGTDPNLGPEDLAQPRSPALLYFHQPGLTPGATYYWRVDEIEADMTTVHTGDVWTFTAQPTTAYLPDPADGSNEASTDPNATLTWLPGQNAIQHQVYFSANFDDVNDGAAAADQGVTEDTVFSPGALQPLTTYYWRVDTTSADGAVHEGEVWNFATFSPVDDFEAYTNEVGARPFEVWVDGVGFSLPEPGSPGNGTNAAVGHDVWDPESPYFNDLIMETTVVHGGEQSMPVSYDNTTAPNYSEIERTWPVAQNWLTGGADTLVLYMRGMPTNSEEQLYVVLQDNVGGTATVLYEDTAAMMSTKWLQWKIVLTDLEGLRPSAIAKMIVGVGDRNAPAPGGAGTLFFDDFRLTKPTTVE
jgi:hypothetical protein